MKYWNLLFTEQEADLYIYGDITSMPLFDGDVSANGLVQEIDALDVQRIRVFINSYGGEVKEGMAICNALARSKARVTTVCDGFACSAAANIFMAGDERLMNESSLLFIHNAWTLTIGDADDMRQAADDLEKMSVVVRDSYASKLKIPQEELERMLQRETFIAPAEALEMGFATGIIPTQQRAASQSARKAVMARMTADKNRGTISMELDMNPAMDDVKALVQQLDEKIQAIRDLRQKGAHSPAGNPDPEPSPEGPVPFKNRLRAMRKEK